MNEQDLLKIIGDVPKVGGRTYVFPSNYGVEVGVSKFDVTPETYAGGNCPFVELVLGINDGGPYDGEDISTTLFLSPGKTGFMLGFHSHNCKAITGQGPDMSVLTKYGMVPTSTDRKEAQREMAEAYFSHNAEERMNFWRDFARVPLWNGRTVVAEIAYEYDKDQETGEKKCDENGNPYPPKPRVVGFTAVNDAKHGLAWVKRVCHPKQQEALDASYDPREDVSIR